jgi:hypothetical protein
VPPVRLAGRPGGNQLLAGVPERPASLDHGGEAGRVLADAGKHPGTGGSPGMAVDRLRTGRLVVERNAERRPAGLGRPVGNQVRAAADAHHRRQDETGNPEHGRLGDLERHARLEAVGSPGRSQQRRDQRPGGEDHGRRGRRQAVRSDPPAAAGAAQPDTGKGPHRRRAHAVRNGLASQCAQEPARVHGPVRDRHSPARPAEQAPQLRVRAARPGVDPGLAARGDRVACLLRRAQHVAELRVRDEAAVVALGEIEDGTGTRDALTGHASGPEHRVQRAGVQPPLVAGTRIPLRAWSVDDGRARPGLGKAQRGPQAGRARSHDDDVEPPGGHGDGLKVPRAAVTRFCSCWVRPGHAGRQKWRAAKSCAAGKEPGPGEACGRNRGSSCRRVS